MKKYILSTIFATLILLSMNISYAIDAPVGYYMAGIVNSIMSIIISLIIVGYLIKFTKTEDKKMWVVKFINTLTIAVILKLTSWIWPLCFLAIFCFFTEIIF